MTTSTWVITGRSERFPLLHHWRVLPGAPPPGDELADIDAAVSFWGGDPAVRVRLDELANASASLVLFLEHLPCTVTRWLDAQVSLGERAALAAAATLESELVAGTTDMNSHGVIHFDAHFDNVLTDGHRLYFADLGLATSTDFALSPDEASLAHHGHTHDVAYVLTRLVNWLVTTLGDPALADPVLRNDVVRACAAGARVRGLPPAAAGTVGRYAPVAAVVNDFYAELFTVDRSARYPAEAVTRELTRLAEQGHLPLVEARVRRPGRGRSPGRGW